MTFEDVIAEPVSVRSGDRVWIWSHALFEVCRIWIYRIVSVLLAIPMSVLSGLLFAILNCFHIWWVQLSLQQCDYRESCSFFSRTNCQMKSSHQAELVMTQTIVHEVNILCLETSLHHFTGWNAIQVKYKTLKKMISVSKTWMKETAVMNKSNNITDLGIWFND